MTRRRKELEQLQKELLSKVDEFFPKVKPEGRNKGRGESAVLVGLALAGFYKSLQAHEEELIEKMTNWLLKQGYIKENKLLPKIKAGHGTCCCCQECGRHHDECVCESNRFVKFLDSLRENNDKD